MKRIYHLFFIAFIGTIIFSSCEKADSLAQFADGTSPVLSASVSTVAPPPADSNKVVLTLSWTDPGHAQDKSLYKYYLEVDSTGRNFSQATRIDITQDKDKRTYSFIGKQLNTILLSYGFAFNVAYDIDVRVTSSYGNNNEQKKSNILKIRVTPYKIPPKVQLPTTNKLFIHADSHYSVFFTFFLIYYELYDSGIC